jgi:hypothetical protein
VPVRKKVMIAPIAIGQMVMVPQPLIAATAPDRADQRPAPGQARHVPGRILGALKSQTAHAAPASHRSPQIEKRQPEPCAMATGKAEGP